MSPMAPESIIKFYLLAAFLTGIGHCGIGMNQTLPCVTCVHSSQTSSKAAPPVSPPSTHTCTPWSRVSIFELLLRATPHTLFFLEALPVSPNNWDTGLLNMKMSHFHSLNTQDTTTFTVWEHSFLMLVSLNGIIVGVFRRLHSCLCWDGYCLAETPSEAWGTSPPDGGPYL